MPDKTLIAGIGTCKATDDGDKTLLLDLTSDGVCGLLGSVLFGYALFWLYWMVYTTDLGGSSSQGISAQYVHFFSYTNPQLKNKQTKSPQNKPRHSASLLRLRILYNRISNQDCYLSKIWNLICVWIPFCQKFHGMISFFKASKQRGTWLAQPEKFAILGLTLDSDHKFKPSCWV